MPIATTLLVNLIAVGALMASVWLVSIYRRDVSIVDVFWGIGFVFITWLTFGISEIPPTTRTLVLACLISIWGLRLACYLAWRNWGADEDHRYHAMRVKHGRRFPLISAITVFGLQGLLMWTISLPVQVGIVHSSRWNGLATLGVILWGTGLCFEAIGDFQLARFKARNRGGVMNRGLWRYTRHPNYFGDFLVWWGLYLVAAERTSWWWTILGPALMTFLLIRVSGVRLLESSLRGRIDGYEEYVQVTSPFFPLPPKRRAGEIRGVAK